MIMKQQDLKNIIQVHTRFSCVLSCLIIIVELLHQDSFNIDVMKIKKIGFTVLLLCIFLKAIAQKSNLIKADKKYDKYAYIDAIAVYEKVAEKGYKDEKMFQRLGNAYYFNGELTKAAKWYDRAFYYEFRTGTGIFLPICPMS